MNKYKKAFRYTLYFYQPAVFDYYTGELCKEKDVSINNSVNYYSGTDKYEGEYAFTTITWKNKSYKIGVRMETSFKWSGSELVSEENGILHKKDSATLSINAFVYAPADYDGLMISLRNIGTSKQDFINSYDKSQKYKKLLNEYNETGEKDLCSIGAYYQ